MRQLKIMYLFLSITVVSAYGQDSIYHEKQKTGFNFGVIPALAYNTDVGFLYGVIANIYNYGDGSKYPDYKYSLYLEWSKTTKGSGRNTIFFDSKYLLPKGIRITGELSYRTNLMHNFYGFNGYDADYVYGFEDQSSAQYISRAYYAHDRKVKRIQLDFQGNTGFANTRWVLGFACFNTSVGTVNIDKINEGLSAEDKLPDVPTLYDKYVEYGIIPESQKNGGTTTYLKTGLVYDTRDNEPNPMRGIWTEAIMVTAPGFLGNDFKYMQLGLIHRQYFTIIKPVLSFAYRAGWQTKLYGTKPFYMLPYIISSYRTDDALGGVKTVRGVLAQRIQGDGIAYGNFEFRYKVFRTTLFKQNFYIGLNTFLDWGVVTQKYKINSTIDLSQLGIKPNSENIHWAAGGGIRFVMNQNFIICVDYGRAFDKRDGTDGLYIDMDYLF